MQAIDLLNMLCRIMFPGILQEHSTLGVQPHPPVHQDIFMLLCAYIARHLQHMVTTISECIPRSYQSGSNLGSDPDCDGPGSGSVVMTWFQY